MNVKCRGSVKDSDVLPLLTSRPRRSANTYITSAAPLCFAVVFVSRDSHITLALPYIDGCYLPKQENEFIHTVLEEIFAFQQRNDKKSVLLFPPLPSRLRFLIHKTVASHPHLTTFSVGGGWARRTVLCYSNLRLRSDGDCRDTEHSSYEKPCSRGMRDSRAPETTTNNRRGARRPDQPVYVPRAMRQKVPENLANLEAQNLNPCRNSTSTAEESSSDIMKAPPEANQEPPGVDSIGQSLHDEEFEVLSRSGSSLWPPAWDKVVSFFSSMALDEEENKDLKRHTALSTDSAVQQSDSKETEKMYSEIKAKLKHEDIVIRNACNHFIGYSNIWLNQDEFTHVIEIYDFPAIFKTDDLLDAFAAYSEGGMEIKWVDNTHALGIFSSQTAATQALSLDHPLLKTRPLSVGSQKAKWKAIRRAEFIQPVKERPRTDMQVARRMVTRALGLRGASREKRSGLQTKDP